MGERPTMRDEAPAVYPCDYCGERTDLVIELDGYTEVICEDCMQQQNDEDPWGEDYLMEEDIR